MRKTMSRRTEKDEKEEASQCYFRNSFCSLITEEEEED